MFEINVEDIFSITGRGTVFLGKILSGKISIGDPVLVKTRSKEINTRVISLEDPGTRKSVQSAEEGSTVGVVCKQIDHKSIADAWQGQGETARVVGVTLTPGTKKKWYQF
jgi:translation elongation factor EF-Tu-like GTPase